MEEREKEDDDEGPKKIREENGKLYSRIDYRGPLERLFEGRRVDWTTKTTIKSVNVRNA